MHERIRKIAAQTFKMQPDEIRFEFTPDDVAGWDSLNHLRLITVIEKEFSIRLTMKQIRTIKSLGDIVDVASEAGAQ